MHDPNMQLIPVSEDQQHETQQQRERRIPQFSSRILIATLVTLALIVGAVASPLIWSNLPVAADSPARLLPARTLQIDSSLFDDQDALAALYNAVAPSVVSIQVVALAPSVFFGQDLPQGGQGSGFIYDNEGHIVTNNHVVDDADSLTVLFHNGYWADAEVVATDPQADLAVIKVTPPDNFDWRPLPLADPDSLRVGHMVIAVGNPFGLDSTMTTGVVSALERGQIVGEGTNRYTLPEIIQTDAAINPGNSGGPLINLHGEVVGVNFAIQSPIRSNSGVGFTIPVSIVHRVVPALIEDGGYRYSFLGIQGRSIGPFSADQLDLPDNQLGVYVAGLVPDGPSDLAGLRGDDEGSGDIIIAIDGQSVRSFEDLVGYLVTDTSPDETVTLTVLRDGKGIEVDVTLTDRPGSTRLTRNRTAPAVENLNAREAIAIAVEAVEEAGLLNVAGNIIKIASPNKVDGEAVWVVELSSGDQTVTVTVVRATGEILDIVTE